MNPLTVPANGNASEYQQQQQRSVDLRWMPKDCDGQIKMGFNIISNAFKSKVKALEEDLRAAHQEKTDLEGKLGIMVQKLQKLERESLEVSLMQSKLTEVEEKLIEKTAELETRSNEFHKRERDVIEENKRLCLNIKSLKKKANQLEAFRRIVVETITRDEELPASCETSENLMKGESVNAKPSSHRVSVGSEFQPFGTRDREFDFQNITQAPSDTPGCRLFYRARASFSVSQFEQFRRAVQGLHANLITVDEALKEVAAICGNESHGLYQELKALLLCGTTR